MRSLINLVNKYDNDATVTLEDSGIAVKYHKFVISYYINEISDLVYGCFVRSLTRFFI